MESGIINKFLLATDEARIFTDKEKKEKDNILNIQDGVPFTFVHRQDCLSHIV